jgi:hypothetical protein
MTLINTLISEDHRTLKTIYENFCNEDGDDQVTMNGSILETTQNGETSTTTLEPINITTVGEDKSEDISIEMVDLQQETSSVDASLFTIKNNDSNETITMENLSMSKDGDDIVIASDGQDIILKTASDPTVMEIQVEGEDTPSGMNSCENGINPLFGSISL